ncbi:MAG: serine/threonine protein phosphatase [Ignavibacteriales bacterium]|nr:serine/threonine protein phosphatase [Ignavibacteriales bacterium]
MVAVIGDIHGCYFTLKNLVEKIKTKYPNISIYCVGDLVDRGNYSFEVIEFIKAQNIYCVIGNHDYMFYSNMRDPFSVMAKSWNYNGAETTLESYKDKLNEMDEHLDLIISFPLFYNLDDCFISHAGISKTLENKLPKNILSDDEKLKDVLNGDLFNQNSIIWTRGDLLNIGKLQIVGHTHRKDILFDEKANSLYIDTTSYGNNKLTAAIVDQNKLVEIISEKSCSEDVNRNWIQF